MKQTWTLHLEYLIQVLRHRKVTSRIFVCLFAIALKQELAWFFFWVFLNIKCNSRQIKWQDFLFLHWIKVINVQNRKLSGGNNNSASSHHIITDYFPITVWHCLFLHSSSRHIRAVLFLNKYFNDIIMLIIINSESKLLLVFSNFLFFPFSLKCFSVPFLYVVILHWVENIGAWFILVS